MHFRTEIPVKPSAERITHTSKIVALGSCFAESIGSKLKLNKFTTTINPLGIIYNPVSLFNSLSNALTDHPPDPALIVEYNGGYLHHAAHSTLHGTTKEVLLKLIIKKQQELKEAVTNAEWLLVTLGTAVGYRHIRSGLYVANCHRQPSAVFNKEVIRQADILSAFRKLKTLLDQANPGLKMLFTVSPVRHLKDTLVVNSLSKAILRTSISEITLETKAAQYFPAFEIMTDDLRDYRYYKEDLLHPTPLAINYIWQKFGATYFSAETNHFLREWEKISRSLQHRPFNPESEAHRRFQQQTLQKLQKLSAHYNVQDEIEQLQSQIKEN